MSKSSKIDWLPSPEASNYPAAASYLSLLYADEIAHRLVAKLRRAKVVEFKAKDIFRASQLSLLGVSNSHVKKDLKKIKKRQPLSPLLLIRDSQNGKVIIADGYHRLCAIYQIQEDIWIHCKIV